MESLWTTHAEKQFINGLGMGQWSGHSPRVANCSRTKLLWRYIQAAKRRARWGDMNREEIIMHAESILYSLTTATNQQEG